MASNFSSALAGAVAVPPLKPTGSSLQGPVISCEHFLRHTAVLQPFTQPTAMKSQSSTAPLCPMSDQSWPSTHSSPAPGQRPSFLTAPPASSLCPCNCIIHSDPRTSLTSDGPTVHSTKF
ncbi:hypothetical protein MJG53_008075 [Ovis ammon polii x Ovis aries]|uniref:Uncharacterized protein n=2 Tax=Ovis TaxID=9935 RepID=A0A836ADV5_SHEEP|nr:hypothetical protein JEQ12_017827 [Ovis aries]KAI4582862.1 hypothetical protein MJG53_008075 [Ovis ammon polii x Ovis aries]